MGGKELPPFAPVPWHIRLAWRAAGLWEWYVKDRPMLRAAGWTRQPGGWWEPPVLIGFDKERET